jgi:hypothetical protein
MKFFVNVKKEGYAMKKMLLVIGLLFSLMVMAPQVCFCNEPPPGTWTIIGPPLVGTWIVDYVSGPVDGLYTYSFKFTGCCAVCFDGACHANKVSKEWTDTSTYAISEFTQEMFQDYNVQGIVSKKCNPIDATTGVEHQDAVVYTILTFGMSDIDGDGVDELVGDVVMYYWK